MAPNNFEMSETFVSQTTYSTVNPLKEVIDQNIFVTKAFSEVNSEEINHPEACLSDDFLNFINDSEVPVVQNNEKFPLSDDLTTLLGDDFSTDSLLQSSIDDFDETLFDDVEQIEKKDEIVICDLNEFLQVPPVITFQVPRQTQQHEIPKTVVEHQNYIQPNWQYEQQGGYSYQACSPSSGYASIPSPYSGFNTPIPFPAFSPTPSCSSRAIKKRGRKSKQWEDEKHNQQYLEEAVNHLDELKRKNNISSGKYRKRKAEIIQEMEIEIEIETFKQVALKRQYKKLKKQIKRLNINLYIRNESKNVNF